MNCELVQRRLLGSEAPAQPPAEVRRHLSECPSCRVWHRRLVKAEQQLPLLPTPPSQRKADVVRLILNTPQPAEVNGVVSSPKRLPFSSPTRERGQRRLAVAIALAAALAVFAVGWALWPLSTTLPKSADPLAARRDALNHKLDKAATKQARVETLADEADGVHKEALALARQDDPEKLSRLAKYYIDLLKYVKHNALELSPDALHAIAKRVTDMESAIERTLAEGVKVANRAALQEMALAARTSRDHLLELARET